MRITTKSLKVLVWIIAIFLTIVGSYALWNKLTTPPRLPLKSIKPGQSLNIEFVNQLGGSVSSGRTKPIVVKGSLVYVGIGPRLAILDISNLSNIHLLGQSDIIPGNIGEVVLAGNYVYVAPGVYGDDMGANQELHIVDVSDPTQPQYVSAYSPQDKYVSSVYVFGKYLYVTAKEVNSGFTSFDKDLYILDISNPTQPKEISHYAFNAGISDIAVLGEHIYVATSESGLRILDVSNLQDPREVSFQYPLESGYSLVISESYLYLSGSTKEMTWGFHVLDISNPIKPFEIALQEQGAVDLVSVYQNIAYFWSLGSQSSINYVDISNPKEPRDIGRYEFEGRVVSIQGNVAFIMNADRLLLFDLSDPLRPVELGFYLTLIPDDLLPEFYFNGKKGIVPVSTDMFILDFSDPLSPVIANRYLVGYRYVVESVYGDFVYMDSTKEIQVLNISDTTEPAIVWRHDGYDKNGRPFILATAEKYAYLINPADGFYVYDIANPANPTLISHQSNLKGFDGFDDFAVIGHYLYILDGRYIHILDASDPTAIAEVNLYKFPSDQSGYRRIKVIDDIAFLDNSLYDGPDPAKLTVLNISDPEKPSLITSYYWREYSAISGYSKRAVFINDYDGLHVVDFSNPNKPREIGYYGLDQYASGPYSLALGLNNLVYIVSYPNGLYVLRYLPPTK